MVTAELTWEEWVTIRRIRAGLTKSALSERVGVTRTWLWRGLEADADHPRRVILSDEIKDRIEEVLTQALAEKAAEDEAA